MKTGTTNDIITRQNELEYIELLKAQRQAYTESKKFLLFDVLTPLWALLLLTIGAGAKTNVGYGQFALQPVNNNYTSIENTGTGIVDPQPPRQPGRKFIDKIADSTIYKKNISGGYELSLKEIIEAKPVYYKFEIDNKTGRANDIFFKQELYFIKKFTKKGKTEDEYIANRPQVGDIFILTVSNEQPFQYSLKQKK